jgi:ATP-binding cassette subfamily C protein
VKVPIQAGQIELRGLSFAYGGNGKPTALSAIDLVIADGKTTAIVGSSGAGKTTLADLLLGLIRPQDGAVLVGGVALDPAHLQSWRSQIGYVAQDTYLFNDSVRANLSWAKPDATLEEMEESLRQAAADEFVGHLPDGIDTVIGERGVRLSGGEKQRLSLARALLRKPSLLILDEATNALDSENEQRIYDAINSLHGEMTIVVITHRLTTIRAADLIHVLDRGRLVASGDWDSLMADGDPRFRQLCLAQGIAEPSDLALS